MALSRAADSFDKTKDFKGYTPADYDQKIADLVGYKGRFSSSWDDALKAAETLGAFGRTLTLGRGSNGIWTVRCQYTRQIYGRSEFGPIAVCQMILIKQPGESSHD